MKHLLTPHFDLYEFVVSRTANKLNIDNTPSVDVIQNIYRLCTTILEPLRLALNYPILISSGYRCPDLNKAVGGVIDSQHLYGCAADIFCQQKSTTELWHVLSHTNITYDQCILYYTFIHISIPVGDDPYRNQFLDFRPDKHCL